MLAPTMQFYFYRIDKKVMGAKWSRALALLALLAFTLLVPFSHAIKSNASKAE
jgi:hypothetical protein